MLIKLIYCTNQKLWFYLSILNLALFISCSSNSGSIDNFKQNEQTAFNEGDTKFVPKSWQHMQGRIYRTEAIAEDGKKLWESTTTNNTYSEISETNDEVILEGQSFQVKLTADACYKKMPNEDWTYLYPGGWEFIEDYEAFKNDLMASSSEVPMPPPSDEGGSAPANAGNIESNAQSSSNSKSNTISCTWCNGTGLCLDCNKTVKKYYLKDDCRTEERNEVKLGYKLCTSCYGWGYSRTPINCPCSNCYEKDCSVYNCLDGWVFCNQCNSIGKGSNLGKCKECKGTGKKQ